MSTSVRIRLLPISSPTDLVSQPKIPQQHDAVAIGFPVRSEFAYHRDAISPWIGSVMTDKACGGR